MNHVLGLDKPKAKAKEISGLKTNYLNYRKNRKESSYNLEALRQ